jgi:glycosyltransferase involved in cell wall biosynthesis
MKICILANALSVHTQRWAKAFADNGHDVHIVSIRNADIPGAKVHSVCIGKVNSKNVIFVMLSYFRLLFCISRIIKKIAPDIVNAHYALTHGVIAAYANRHPLIISVWGSDVIWDKVVRIPSFMKIFLKYAFKKADAVCVTSKFMIQYVLPVAPREINISQIPFGIDCNLFAPVDFKKPADCIRIGYVKTLEGLYGPDVLINAIQRVLKVMPDAKLIMAGSDKMNGKLKTLAEELNIADKVEFTGFIPNEKVPELLNSFDIYVHPSICTESFGVAVLEASACGCPVVATRIGGVPEVCIDGRTGILVEPNNPDALADAIIKLAKNPELRHNMARAGREFVVNNYDWNKNVESMLRVMKDTILKNKK